MGLFSILLTLSLSVSPLISSIVHPSVYLGLLVVKLISRPGFNYEVIGLTNEGEHGLRVCM